MNKLFLFAMILFSSALFAEKKNNKAESQEDRILHMMEEFKTTSGHYAFFRDNGGFFEKDSVNLGDTLELPNDDRFNLIFAFFLEAANERRLSTAEDIGRTLDELPDYIKAAYKLYEKNLALFERLSYRIGEVDTIVWEGDTVTLYADDVTEDYKGIWTKFFRDDYLRYKTTIVFDPETARILKENSFLETFFERQQERNTILELLKRDDISKKNRQKLEEQLRALDIPDQDVAL